MTTPDASSVERWWRWSNSWTALSLPGLGLAILIWGPLMVIGTTAGFVIPVALAIAMVEQVIWLQQPRAPGALVKAMKRIGRATLCLITFVISALAVGTFVPGLAVLLVLFAGATTPPATALLRRMLTRTDFLAGAHPDGTESATAVKAPADPARNAHAMTNSELCCAWRRSYWILLDAKLTAETMSVVLQRQCLLDELEARNAPALEAWLASGARASSGPERFLADDGGDQPTAA